MFFVPDVHLLAVMQGLQSSEAGVGDHVRNHRGKVAAEGGLIWGYICDIGYRAHMRGWQGARDVREYCSQLWEF